MLFIATSQSTFHTDVSIHIPKSRLNLFLSPRQQLSSHSTVASLNYKVSISENDLTFAGSRLVVTTPTNKSQVG